MTPHLSGTAQERNDILERIAIVEDDAYLREELASILVGAGFDVLAFERFDNLVAGLLKAAPQLVLLDLGLPGISGYEIVRSLRGQGSNVLVLILTAQDRLASELRALDLGADDYLTKPVEAARLLARVNSLLRRSALAAEGGKEGSGEGRAAGRVLAELLLVAGQLRLDPTSYTLYAQDTSLRLTPQEGHLLTALFEQAGEVVSKQQLCKALWGTTEYIDENALQVTLARLRKTLRHVGLGGIIVTVRGEGLRLDAAAGFEKIN